MVDAYRVFVVLDEQYGDRLQELNCHGPVWLIDTPSNRAAAQKIWSVDPNCTHLAGVTSFKFVENASAEDILINELDTIDLHHGSYSADPPYTILEAIGVEISERIREALSQFGFNNVQATTEGFRAVRPLPPDSAAK